MPPTILRGLQEWLHAAALLHIVVLISMPNKGYTSQSYNKSDVAKICRTSIIASSPICQHGGVLKADNQSAGTPQEYQNCASCICPDGWQGAQCSLCAHKGICATAHHGPGPDLEVEACTSGSILPSTLEMAGGKQLSCDCGGDDPSTKWVCSQQPATNWDMHVLPSRPEADWRQGNAELTVVERAGTPSQDYWPPCPTGKNCPTPARYRYAYADVWSAKFYGCAWSTGPCTAPLEGDDCALYKCSTADVECPPRYVPRCPGYTILGCGKPPNESLPYWSHHCMPGSYPTSDKPLHLACLPRPLPDGAFQCYISQEDSAFASLGLRCRTGSCIYRDPGDDPSPPSPPQPPPGPPRPSPHSGTRAEVAAMGAIGGMVVVVLCAMLLLLQRDQLQARSGLACRAGLAHIGQSNGDGPADVSSGLLWTAAEVQADAMIHVEGRPCALLSWRHISYAAHQANGRRMKVLRRVWGTAGGAPGLFALMGPSGSGKTTLLDVLAGRKAGRSVAGAVTVNGHSVNSTTMKSMSSYVTQDDVLPGTLSVWEYLLFRAFLSLGPDAADRAARHHHVRHVMEALGLGGVANSTIGDQYTRGLSGGERRRVSIAVELLCRPALLFLDEPTTGLDSASAAVVVDLLARVAQRGVTVVMSLHQPRADMLQAPRTVLLLSARGQVMYFGSTTGAGGFLALLGHPPSPRGFHALDVLLDLAISLPRDDVDLLVDACKSHCCSQWQAVVTALQPLPSRKHIAPFMRQLRALSTRLLRTTARHPLLVALNLVAALATAALLGAVFHKAGTDTGGIQNRLGALFFMLMYLAFSAISSLPVWREEKLLFMRERDAGAYGTLAYFVAVLLFDLLPLRLFPPLAFALLSYGPMGLHPGSATCVLRFAGVLVLANLAATALCMALGALAPSNAVANFGAGLSLMSLMLFGGFLLNKERVPPLYQPLELLSLFNYAYEALAVNEFHHSPLEFTFTAPIDSAVLPPIRISGEGVLHEFGFQADRLAADLAALAGLAAAAAGATFALLAMSGRPVWPAVAAGIGSALLGSRRAARSAVTVLTVPAPGARLERGALGHWLSGNDAGARGDRSSDDEGGSSGSERGPLLAGTLDDEERGDAVGAAESSNMLQSEQQAIHAGLNSPAAKPTLGSFALPVLASGSWGAGAASPLASPLASAGPHQPHLTWNGVSVTVHLPRGGGRRLVLDGVYGEVGWPPLPRQACGICDACRRSRGSVLCSPCHGIARPPSSACGGENGRVDLFAVMGPSGSGKTTLLDVLAGRKGGSGVQGDVRVDGQLLAARRRQKLCGYVLQDDVLPGTSTVEEYLSFHAALRLPAQMTHAQRQQRLHTITRQLMLDKVMATYIGDAFVRGLSGGERRRVSIAVELLCRPALLFLDEPTTGLDSASAAAVVDLLARVARRAVASVVLAVHQPRPDMLQHMDRLLMLSGRGQVVYMGQTAVLDAWLADAGVPLSPSSCLSAADQLLDTVAHSPPHVLQALVQHAAHTACNTAGLPVSPFVGSRQVAALQVMRKYEASAWRQFAELSRRLSRHSVRHPLLIMLNMGAAAAMAVVLGTVYWRTGTDTGGIQDRFGALFFMLIYLALGSLSSLPVWRDGQMVFVRERAAGVYGTSAYFAAVLLLDLLPLRLLPPTAFSLVSYHMVGLRRGTALAAGAVLVLHNIAASALSMAIGAALPSPAAANMVASLAMLGSTLLGGFFLSRNNMSAIVHALAQLSFVRHSFEALAIIEFHGAAGFKFTGFHEPGAPPDKVPFVDVDGDTVLQTFGFRIDGFTTNVVALIFLCVFYLSGTYFSLKYRMR